MFARCGAFVFWISIRGVWLYDYKHGVFDIRAEGRVRQLATEKNFPGERVDCFHEDREGNFWAGVDRGGLVRVREKRFSVLTPGASVAERTTVSVAEDAEGGLGTNEFSWSHQKTLPASLPETEIQNTLSPIIHANWNY